MMDTHGLMKPGLHILHGIPVVTTKEMEGGEGRYNSDVQPTS